MGLFAKLRPIAQAYVASVVLTGALVVAWSLADLWTHPVGVEWFALAALTLLTGSFTVKVPSTNASLSVSEAFVFASVLMFGPSAGATTVLLECLAILFWMPLQGKPLHRLLFNLAAPAIAVWVSGTVFFATSSLLPSAQQAAPLHELFPPLVIFTILYFLLNSWLVAIALGLDTGSSAFAIWRENFTWVSVNYFSGASLAALLVTYARGLDLSALLVIVPLLVVSYLTFRTAMGRIEDTNAHLGELNQLYLSTIEMLAMAIDAKDQITHGHIRRVQTSATELAGHIGIADKGLIRAIEAAALLHDMGKLAIPEHILNKPGKLTAEEFERMKQHASIGADILSAISFPYPVVPIVRHHHENWDGTGYPDGLSRTQIPIGARILAVVDCFDALTSDRPYRRKLSDEEAIKILVDRRGTMYDPLVVDTFIRLVQTSHSPHPHEVLDTLGVATDPSTKATPDLLASAARATECPSASNSESPEVLARAIADVVPNDLALIFAARPADDTVEVVWQSGHESLSLVGLRISLGKGVSGWVAANRKGIANSDPALDLGEVVSRPPLHLLSTLSVPIILDDRLEGVLACYSRTDCAYQQSHQAALEILALGLGPALRGGEIGRWAGARSITAPPGGETVLLVTILGLAEFERLSGREPLERAIANLTNTIKKSLRENDVVVRYSRDQLLVLVNSVEGRAERSIDLRLQDALKGAYFEDSDRSQGLRLRITKSSSPSDGVYLHDLVASAGAGTPARQGSELPFLVH